jgi:hypothetical protein
MPFVREDELSPEEQEVLRDADAFHRDVLAENAAIDGRGGVLEMWKAGHPCGYVYVDAHPVVWCTVSPRGVHTGSRGVVGEIFVEAKLTWRFDRRWKQPPVEIAEQVIAMSLFEDHGT